MVARYNGRKFQGLIFIIKAGTADSMMRDKNIHLLKMLLGEMKRIG